MAPSRHPRVKILGEHRYLVTIGHEDGDLQIAVYANPDFISKLAAPPGSETQIVVGTIAYLTARQSTDDLPPQLDLEDVAAAYDGFEAELRNWLQHA